MKRQDARQYMLMAIEEMRKSIAEPRDDGKVSPKVGAVLVKPDETVETAHRGELRYGDHAEYTLLERKNRPNKLDDSILFATLEPCAPNSRRHPKLGCAERIVNARIKEVWIGIEDPDPTVDRKGIKYLQDAGIKVQMFDADLQEIITNENRVFIGQALERAATAEKKAVEIILSPLENALNLTSLDDLSDEALEAYRLSIQVRDAVDSSSFKLRLVRQGLLQQEGNEFIPTGFGLLLFGNEPRESIPQAGLLATIHYPDGKEGIHNFEGPQVLVPNLALQWLHDKLPNVISRSEAQRREISEPIFELVREGIVNALVHRDYNIAGAKCQLIVTQDVIEIKSPGLPVEPITLEEMQSFSASMLSRNPVLHYVFARMKLAEERGLGLKSMKRRAEEIGLPLPKYTWQNPYLVLTLYRTSSAAITVLPEDIQKKLSETERAGLQWLTVRGQTKASEYAAAVKLDERTARRHLRLFVELGLVKKSGTARLTTYEVSI